MLSKTHETTYLVPVNYINYPADLLDLVPPADFVKVRIKASGVSIISFHLFNSGALILNYDVANSQPIRNGKNLFWIMNSKRKELADILGASTEIMNVNPERILIPFANKIAKEIPLILNAEINLKHGFWLANDIKIIPASVTLYGEQNLLDSINTITTDLLKLDDLEKDQLCQIPLIIPDGLKGKLKTVSVEINVEAFIEEEVTQEVEIRYLEKRYSMKLFPKDVDVTLRLPKNKFQLLKTDLLRLYVDASEIGGQRMIPVRYDNLPEGVKVERLYPNHLEFLLIKD